MGRACLLVPALVFHAVLLNAHVGLQDLCTVDPKQFDDVLSCLKKFKQPSCVISGVLVLSGGPLGTDGQEPEAEVFDMEASRSCD